jgi:hypothetical protein
VFFIYLLLFLIPALADAADYYVAPNGSGTACTQNTPCSREEGMNRAVGSDRVRFLDGTYPTPSNGIRLTRNGTSSSARLTYESVNPRGAIIRFNGPDGTGASDAFIVEADNIIVRGFRIMCTSASGNNTWDCVQANGTRLGNEVQNVLFDNIYASDSGHLLFGCYLSNNIELRNSTFDFSGIDHDHGEGMYLSSCCGKNNPCRNLTAHHNIFARFGENGIDFKNQTRATTVRDSIFMDHRAKLTNANEAGDALWLSQGNTAGAGTTAAGNYVRDSIAIRPITDQIWKSTDDIRMDMLNNVIVDFNPVGTATGQINGPSGVATAQSSGNLHCPASDNVSQGVNKLQGGPANVINRPMSECQTRINQILGVPGISSCEIGTVNNTTLVVNLQADKNGPVSSVGTAGQLAVTYDSAAQTENSVTIPSANQARIVMAQAPENNAVVRVTPASGVIKNSAFIGGRNCSLAMSALLTDPGGTARTPNKIANGNGVCGSNTSTAAVTCTNNVDDGTNPPPPPPPVPILDQAVFRFYAEHGAEGTGPLSPEQGHVTLAKGKGFRLRIAVRGGGNTSPTRSYALASRICSPTCGGWLFVTDDYSGTGITLQDDQVQQDGTPTTNQLSIGTRVFLAGAFQETDGNTPAVAIAETNQIEWEWSLDIPVDNNPLVPGNRVEFRVQQNDGGVLNTYSVLPSVTIGSMSYSGGGAHHGGRVQ